MKEQIDKEIKQLQEKKKKIKEERIEGGLADNMTLEDLAKHHEVEIDEIINAMEKGVNVEFEHTTEMMVAFEIAMDHIYEDLDYYDKLKKKLIKMGYVNDNKIIDDEIQAFMSTGLYNGLNTKELKVYEKEFKNNFKKFNER